MAPKDRIDTTETTETTETNPYDDAFATALGTDDAGETVEQDTTPAEDHDAGDADDHDAGDADDQGDHAAEGDEADDGEEAAETAEGQEGAEGDADDGQETDEVLNRLAALVREREQAIGRDKQHQPKDEQQTGEAQQEDQQTPVPELSTEEQEFLSSYEEDWPDVSRAEALKRKQEYHRLVDYVFREVAKELRPLAEMTQSMAAQAHYQDLTSQVQDYDTIRDQVVEWVGKQPAYLQPAYEHVIREGTVDEVNDLINRYRQETGQAQAAVETTPEQGKKASTKSSSAKKSAELPPATKQAAAALAPVSSKRSAPSGDVDPEDFESAFTAFADKM